MLMNIFSELILTFPFEFWHDLHDEKDFFFNFFFTNRYFKIGSDLNFRFLIGLSIDGPRELHDIYRVDKGGRPTFDKVMRGLRLLQKHGVEYNLLTTVNRVNADYPLEVYKFLPKSSGYGGNADSGGRRGQTANGPGPNEPQ